MGGLIKEELMQSFIRLYKSNWPSLFSHMDVTVMGFMKSVENNSPDSEDNVFLVDLQDKLHISKAAISQIAGSLEEKGLLLRETMKSNRRKLMITLTPEGKEALSRAQQEFDLLMGLLVSRLGDHDAREAVRIFNLFADIVKEVQDERKERE
ncbi:MAG: transcriptional regulator [Defluviitaleaceae bacterium]|nr:transcriptional regulator [Defluviitaleaceae bacterium]